MSVNSLSLASLLNTYGTSTSSKTSSAANQATSATSDDSVVQAALAKAIANTNSATPNAHTSTKLTVARQHLNLLQQGLAKDLKAALSKAGQQLTGTVDFSVGADGKLAVSGNDKDKASVAAALASDKSVPSLSSRLTDLNKQAAAFDRQNIQSNAVMVAARSAGTGSQNLVSVYQSLMASQPSSLAVFSMSDKSSQVAFSGAVATKA